MGSGEGVHNLKSLSGLAKAISQEFEGFINLHISLMTLQGAKKMVDKATDLNCLVDQDKFLSILWIITAYCSTDSSGMLMIIFWITMEDIKKPIKVIYD